MTNPLHDAAMADDRRPFSVPQLAYRWGCSEALIRKLIRDQRLQCFRLGALIRISASEVERFECESSGSIPSNDCSADMQSSTSTKASASGEGSTARIARAPRRKRGSSMPSADLRLVP